MNSYSFKWIVRVPRGQIMAGVHRFKTKKAAEKFVYEWNRACQPGSLISYDDLPRVEKEGK